MVRSISGIISTSRWHPIASATNTIPTGIDGRRMRLPPWGSWQDDPRARRNKPVLKVSMGRGLLRLGILGKPFRLLGGLQKGLRVRLPPPGLPDGGVQLVFGEPQGVDEAILRLEDVRDLRLVALGLSRVDGEVEDLDVGVAHHRLRLLHVLLLVLSLPHRLR